MHQNNAKYALVLFVSFGRVCNMELFCFGSVRNRVWLQASAYGHCFPRAVGVGLPLSSTRSQYVVAEHCVQPTCSSHGIASFSFTHINNKMKLDPREYKRIAALLKRRTETAGTLVPNTAHTAWIVKPMKQARSLSKAVTFQMDASMQRVFHTHVTACATAAQCAYDPPSVKDIQTMIRMCRTTPVSVVFSKQGTFVMRFPQKKTCARCTRTLANRVLALQQQMLPGMDYNRAFVQTINQSCCVRCRMYMRLRDVNI